MRTDIPEKLIKITSASVGFRRCAIAFGGPGRPRHRFAMPCSFSTRKTARRYVF